MWLGVPLHADGRTIGLLAVQTYEAHERYSEADKALLTFVAQHIGSALSRARAIEETRERNAELSLINEIGEALAKQLDFGAIIELVGERVRIDLRCGDRCSSACTTRRPTTLTFPYDIDEGESLRSRRRQARSRHHIHRDPLGSSAPHLDARGTGSGRRHPDRRHADTNRGLACRSRPEIA